jgi:hypothetical protein
VEGVGTELEYTIRRLVRGLASSRQGARQGFSLALTEVLSEFPEVDIETVMKTMEESMAVTGVCLWRMWDDVPEMKYFGPFSWRWLESVSWDYICQCRLDEGTGRESQLLWPRLWAGQHSPVWPPERSEGRCATC